MKCDLAMFGGKKAVHVPLGLYNSIGTEEEKAARNVSMSLVLAVSGIRWPFIRTMTK